MTEHELSEKVKARERVAYGLLYETYAEELLVVISRYIVEREQAKDLLHDCFIKIFDKIHQFKYQGEGSLGAWLRRLCINESLMQLRKESRFTSISIDQRDDLELQALEIAEPTEEQVDSIPAEVLEEMIKSLPDGYRTVLVLFIIEGKSHKEIAALLGINEKSSSSQLTRAKKQLAKSIEDWYRNTTN